MKGVWFALRNLITRKFHLAIVDMDIEIRRIFSQYVHYMLSHD